LERARQDFSANGEGTEPRNLSRDGKSRRAR
jgi:hypothetical protein